MHALDAKLLFLATVTVAAAPASATFHRMQIREIFAGTAGAPDAQYVLLQMISPGQSQVGGHAVTVFDASGAVAGTFAFGGAVANAGNQATILVATAEAEALFSVTADLGMLPVIDPAAGKVCFDTIDCVSWGAFDGNYVAPSPSGSPYGPGGGLSSGHAIRRDDSRGTPGVLDAADDTNDSFSDFACVATAEPINNAGASGTYTDPDPCPACGNATKETGEMCDGADDAACPGGCQVDCLCPRHDSWIAPLKPLSVQVPGRSPFAVSKKVSIRVTNVDAHAGSDVIKLLASTGDCPPGVAVTPPDFAPPSGIDTVSLGAGKSAKAIVHVSVEQTAFATFNRKAPARCTLEFTTATLVTGNADPVPSNNLAILELNVVDHNDAETASPPEHESLVASLKPLKISIGRRKDSAAKKAVPAVTNADILPSPDAGDVIALGVDTSGCPGLAATVDMDKKTAGDQASVAVDGGRSTKGRLVLAANTTDFTTRNRKSPERCFATVTATGPSDPDPEPSNNRSTLVIDVIDGNDF